MFKNNKNKQMQKDLFPKITNKAKPAPNKTFCGFSPNYCIIIIIMRL
jgi:hypothetical protein